MLMIYLCFIMYRRVSLAQCFIYQTANGSQFAGSFQSKCASVINGMENGYWYLVILF